MLVLREPEIRATAGLDHEALDRVEEAFTWLARGRATVPPVMVIDVEGEGEVDVKSAYVEGLSSFAVKIASGFPGNEKRGLPTSGGLMVVVGATTGLPEAVLLDDGYLTSLRTALAGAVAARHLAPTEVGTVGVVGTGSQARWQVRALALVRDFRRVLVHGRRESAAARCAEDLAGALGVETEVAPAEEVARCDVVVTTTSAREPVVRAEWIRSGTHVTAMGSDTPGKRELGHGLLRRADRLVCDLRSQAVRLGELQWASSEGIDPEHDAVELGELTSGERPGRRSDDEITVCDLTGVGVQDTAIARYVVARRTQGNASAGRTHR